MKRRKTRAMNFANIHNTPFLSGPVVIDVSRRFERCFAAEHTGKLRNDGCFPLLAIGIKQREMRDEKCKELTIDLQQHIE